MDSKLNLHKICILSIIKLQHNIQIGECIKMADTKATRSRWIACVFYPDNEEHMELYEYFNSHVQMVSILHKGEPKATGGEDQGENTETGKDHIHALLYFEFPRTLKSFVTACDGALQHAELVNDCFAYATYMLHATFAARHKTQYDKSQIIVSRKGGEIYAKLYGRDDKKSDIEMILYMSERAHEFQSFGSMVLAFAKEGLQQLVNFCKRNTYFIQNLLKAKWKHLKEAADLHLQEVFEELDRKQEETQRLQILCSKLKYKLQNAEEELYKATGKLNPFTSTFSLNDKPAVIL